MRRLAILIVAVGCGGGGGGDVDSSIQASCTPAGQEIEGTVIEFTTVELAAEPTSCSGDVLSSVAEVEAAFPGGAPAELTAVDFGVARVILTLSNPVLRFVADDGAQIVLGEELLCQGAAPSCQAHIADGTTRDTATVHDCPYLGPDPCLAP